MEAWRSGVWSQSLLLKTSPRVKFLLGLGGWGSVLLGWTGLVLSGNTRNHARLVYGSAALVAPLRGQQSHFATLPIHVAPFSLCAYANCCVPEPP